MGNPVDYKILADKIQHDIGDPTLYGASVAVSTSDRSAAELIVKALQEGGYNVRAWTREMDEIL